MTAMSVEPPVVRETATPRLDYRGVFGWPVRWHNGGLTLVTGGGIGGVAVPKGLAEQIISNVGRQGCSGPAVSVPTRHGMVVILLVEADALAALDDPLPDGVKVLTAGTAIPLPNERRPDDLARWLVPPDIHQRWLPSQTAVLASIRSVFRARRHVAAR
ncbi:MAG TPA: hypothetical protein VJ870_10615 [Amycolatopsis sp.]|nr:hypothetical protein [Amycolatopsis sp.]